MANQITPNPSVPSQVVAEVKFPKFINNLGIIPTSYKDSMSYYECLAWLCKFLEEQVIPTVNENGEAVEELQNLYVELNSYVTHYFDTLDVQEEINNKLDDMVEAGTLQEIIADYLNSKAVFGYDNVAEMKNATNLIEGSYARTLGYYEKNDGGNGFYKIRNIKNDDIIDEGSIISLNDESNQLIAELIVENNINVKQFGAYGDNLHNDTTAFNKIISYLSTSNYNTLNIPKGTYIIDNLPLKNNINIIGEGINQSILKTSANTSSHFAYINEAPIQKVTYEGFQLKNNNTSNCIGLDLTAIEQSSSPYTGGIWDSSFKNIRIDGFLIGLKLHAIDIQGDLADQFLQFDNIEVIRNGESSSEYCLLSEGQVQHVLFSNSKFDSRISYGPGYGVKLESGNSNSGGSDSNTVIKFLNCSFQNHYHAFTVIGSARNAFAINISNSWFENNRQSIYIGLNVSIMVNVNHFANAGNGENNDGYICYLGQQSNLSFINNSIIGTTNKLISGDNKNYGYINKGTYCNTLPSTSGITGQISINSSNTITPTRENLYFVNGNDTNSIKTIDAPRLGTSNEISILCLGNKPVKIEGGGNIKIQNPNAIILRNNDVATFTYQDLTNSWVVKSTSINPLKTDIIPSNATSPYHAYYFNLGEIVYRQTPTAGGYIGWICTASGTPRNLEKFWFNRIISST